VKKVVKQKCPVCLGEKRLYVAKPTGIKETFAIVNERCPICSGTGYIKKD